MKIQSSDISVVVQGAVDKESTPKCLASIRKYLPEAEIILSTWKGTDFSSLNYDVVLFNKDPGAVDLLWFDGRKNNGNRQLYSTQEGIKKASRKYILKLRTDLFLENANFLEYWDKFSKFDDKYFVFKHKILSCTVYVREKFQTNAFLTPFHPSDFWFFGLKEDLEDYFSKTVFQNDVEAGSWSYKYPNKVTDARFYWQFPPEQYYCVAWAKRHFPEIAFDDLSDWNRVNFELSKKILYNNFIFLGYNQSGIMSSKQGHRKSLLNEEQIKGLVTFRVYEQRYKEFCDNSYEIVYNDDKNKNEQLPKYTYKQKLKIEKYLTKLQKHCHNFIEPIKKFLHWFFEPLSILLYSIKIIIRFITRFYRLFCGGNKEKNGKN